MQGFSLALSEAEGNLRSVPPSSCDSNLSVGSPACAQSRATDVPPSKPTQRVRGRRSNSRPCRHCAPPAAVADLRRLRRNRTRRRRTECSSSALLVPWCPSTSSGHQMLRIWWRRWELQGFSLALSEAEGNLRSVPPSSCDSNLSVGSPACAQSRATDVPPSKPTQRVRGRRSNSRPCRHCAPPAAVADLRRLRRNRTRRRRTECSSSALLVPWCPSTSSGHQMLRIWWRRGVAGL